ncbi:MAG: hypothetical protein AB8B50_14550 [Pirellulaceae bacterium]
MAVSKKNVSRTMRLQSPSREAATIIEVLFAIFVVVVGLMGIASLFPLAARNAEESNAANNALTQGRIWLSDFVARGFNDHDGLTQTGNGYNWVWRQDYAQPGTPVLQPGLYPVSKFGPPNNQGTGTARLASTPTFSNPAHSQLELTRFWSQQSYCLDPLFMSDPDVITGFNAGGNGRVAGFRASVFPYYEDGHNPTEDAAVTPAQAPWEDQPRMLRVSLGGGAGQIPRKLVNDLFVSKDDLATLIDDTDDAVPATRIFSAGGGKNLTTGDYTWMATVSPEFTDSPLAVTNAYVMSLVIMQRRDRQYIGSTLTPIAGTKDSKPNGERLLWVYPLSGNFDGGTGGRVRLISNVDVEERLHVGDWIMLGKHYALGGSPTQRFSVFRWYRIVAADADPIKDQLQNVIPTNPQGNGTDPYGNNSQVQVWARDVVLEGPDWDFTPALGTIVTPTSGTLMSNVVTVLERSIQVD